MKNRDDGYREYAAERKANIIRMLEDLRSSDSVRSAFMNDASRLATKYGLTITEEEASALAAAVDEQELSEEALAAVAGGGTNNGCINNKCGGDDSSI